MDKKQREKFFFGLQEELLIGGAAFSEWSVFISKSAYDAFINGADLAAIITTLAGIESYLRTEDPNSKGKNLFTLINEYDFIDEETRVQIHQIRKYRNKWVHLNDADDTAILENEQAFVSEAEEMAILAITLLMKVLLSQQFI